MKKLTKILLAAGGAALICGGSVMTYLKAQTPVSAQEELTLANIEAMAILPGKLDLWDEELPSYATCVIQGYPSSTMHYKCPEGTSSSKILPCSEMVAQSAYPEPFPGMRNSGTCYLSGNGN
ncbi:hypothetical protein [uncultured Rikenella sp.]|uniref:hypothetical protein n=1 Tax=uncultured Rikenella sp. TaxID=368003 RepID=UPI002606565C|nr:hypothetical protein [uncultured Rikenella sp.]